MTELIITLLAILLAVLIIRFAWPIVLVGVILLLLPFAYALEAFERFMHR